MKSTVSTEDIVKAVASNSEVNLSQKDVRACLKGIEEAVAQAIGNGDKVQLTGFATFKPVYRGERTANNIQSNQPMQVPESMSVNIKAGSSLKTAVSSLNPAEFNPDAPAPKKEAKKTEAKAPAKSKSKK